MRKSQNGSALIMLFVAVGLFAALAFAFTQGSRTNVGMMSSEAAKAEATKDAGYSHAVSTAVKRLKLRGCNDSEISYETPKGNNVNASAPTDKRCHVFRIEGGGVQFSGADATPADPCTLGPIGSVCTSDGAIYIGEMASNRIYAAATNQGSLKWKIANTDTNGTGSTTDGLTNVNSMITFGIGDHPAAHSCNQKSPTGTWYLPAKDELMLIWTNRAVINLSAHDIYSVYYQSSTQFNSGSSWRVGFASGTQGGSGKTLSDYVRCVRR